MILIVVVQAYDTIKRNIENIFVPTKDENILSVLKKEMGLFENGGHRGKNLEILYSYLLTIPPTSIEPERAFSFSGYLLNPYRTRMNDETFDSLCFLRAYIF